SFAQQRLWLLDQLDPELSAYHLATSVTIEGQLDVRALERSLSELVRRHEAVRTRIAVEAGVPVQVVDAPYEIKLEVIDLSGFEEGNRKKRAQHIARQEAQRRFDLSKDRLLRTKLILLRPQHYILIVVMHHIISDGWSMGVLIQELGLLYAAYSRGEALSLPEMPIQYADYA